MSKSKDNFIRLAEHRTKRTLKDIRLIGNLSNRSNYSWYAEDVKKIFSAIESELRISKQKFEDAKRFNKTIEFSLKE